MERGPAIWGNTLCQNRHAVEMDSGRLPKTYSPVDGFAEEPGEVRQGGWAHLRMRLLELGHVERERILSARSRSLAPQRNLGNTRMFVAAARWRGLWPCQVTKGDSGSEVAVCIRHVDYLDESAARC